jgi:hypothetical protein
VSITNGGDNVDSPRNLIDEGSSQSGDRSYGQVGGRITNLGADANRVLAILKTQIDKDAQFRKLWTNALAKLGDKINELVLRQQDMEDLLRTVRGEVSKGDATVLNMTYARLNAHKAGVAEQIAGAGQRITDLERGALVAILEQMRIEAAERAERERREREEVRRRQEADDKDRRERRELQDLVYVAMFSGMGFVILVLCGLAVFLAFLEVF